MATPFPFSAIVGQDEMKQALLIAAVDQSVGGVLVFGDRGTGKSTAIRALAAHEANVNRAESERRQTALMWAAAEGHSAVVKLLAAKGVAARVVSVPSMERFEMQSADYKRRILGTERVRDRRLSRGTPGRRARPLPGPAGSSGP